MLTFSSLTLLSRVTGLARLMLVAAVLGGGRLNDAYQLAIAIPFMLYEFVAGGVLSAVFIPVLVRAQEKSGRTSPEAWRVANLLLGFVGIVLTVLSLLAMAFAPQVVGLMTMLARDSMAEDSRRLAVYLFVWFAPQILFFGLSAVFMAILNSHEVFAVTAAAPIANNLVTIATLALYGTGWIGTAGLAAGTTLAVATQALVQVPALLRLGMPLRPLLRLRDPVFVGLGTLGLPVVMLAAANLLGTAVRANLLYSLPGAYTAYYLSFVLTMMPYGIVAVSIATVLYPAMSRHAATLDFAGYRSAFSLGLRSTLFVMLPVALGLAVCAGPVARLLFERGRFSFAHSQFMAEFLSVYALSILPYAALMFATRAFFALKDTLTPAYVTIGGVAVNIVLNVILFRVLEVRGIALSSVITYSITSMASVWLLRRPAHGVDGRRLGISALKIAAAGAVMAAGVWAAVQWTEPRVVIIERGPRAPLRLPAAETGGHSVIIRESRDWRELWTLLHGDRTPLPRIDFRRETVVLALAPRGATTATLYLRRADTAATATPVLDFDVVRASPQTAVSIPSSAPSQPAFMLVRLAGKVEAVDTRFAIVDQRGGFWRHLWGDAGSLLRVLILVVLGGALYAGAALVLRVEEMRSLASFVFRRGAAPTDDSAGGAAT
ncbi:MAG: murein biosynthesis integral membrane protein MurJ [Candidatus Sumerlaeaceae bacterium]|nr:murein biosynthesis integral membrane protein MurJ [Candidatus Sumerlaeaceae bacterium]